jgi:hypothetical protein
MVPVSDAASAANGCCFSAGARYVGRGWLVIVQEFMVYNLAILNPKNYTRKIDSL